MFQTPDSVYFCLFLSPRCKLCDEVYMKIGKDDHVETCVPKAKNLEELCPHCGKYVLAKALKQHIAITHTDFPCEMCGEIFKVIT